jgi:hypothetical protein
MGKLDERMTLFERLQYRLRKKEIEFRAINASSLSVTIIIVFGDSIEITI